MHNWIMNIGYAILNFFSDKSENIGTALQIAGVGMLGIFIVMGAIILVVSLLNKLGSK